MQLLVEEQTSIAPAAQILVFRQQLFQACLQRLVSGKVIPLWYSLPLTITSLAIQTCLSDAKLSFYEPMQDVPGNSIYYEEFTVEGSPRKSVSGLPIYSSKCERFFALVGEGEVRGSEGE
jgi:hypothetical protein